LTLSVCGFHEVTDAGVRALASLTALTSLVLGHCHKVTDAGVQALLALTALTSLDIQQSSNKMGHHVFDTDRH